MIYAILILIALGVAALVLLIERSGDPRQLEREYHMRAHEKPSSKLKG